jgi:hypothetical protein
MWIGDLLVGLEAATLTTCGHKLLPWSIIRP